MFMVTKITKKLNAMTYRWDEQTLAVGWLKLLDILDSDFMPAPTVQAGTTIPADRVNQILTHWRHRGWIVKGKYVNEDDAQEVPGYRLTRDGRHGLFTLI